MQRHHPPHGGSEARARENPTESGHRHAKLKQNKQRDEASSDVGGAAKRKESDLCDQQDDGDATLALRTSGDNGILTVTPEAIVRTLCMNWRICASERTGAAPRALLGILGPLGLRTDRAPSPRLSPPPRPPALHRLGREKPLRHLLQMCFVT